MFKSASIPGAIQYEYLLLCYLMFNDEPILFNGMIGVDARLRPPLNLLTVKDAASRQDVPEPSQFPFVAPGVRNSPAPTHIESATVLLATMETASGYGRAARSN